MPVLSQPLCEPEWGANKRQFLPSVNPQPMGNWVYKLEGRFEVLSSSECPLTICYSKWAPHCLITI